jgi:hypothetical protein
VVTNYHQLLRTRSADDDPGIIDAERRKLSLLFDDDEPARLEALDTPLVDRFGPKSRGLLVLNDEAHHVWDETGHARFEDRAKEKSRLGKGEDASADMAWIRSIRRLHERRMTPPGWSACRSICRRRCSRRPAPTSRRRAARQRPSSSRPTCSGTPR